MLSQPQTTRPPNLTDIFASGQSTPQLIFLGLPHNSLSLLLIVLLGRLRSDRRGKFIVGALEISLNVRPASKLSGARNLNVWQVLTCALTNSSCYARYETDF